MFTVLDIATCPLDGAAGFLEDPAAPANYKDPEKIAAYIAEKKAELLSRCALDPDLGRISGIAYSHNGENTTWLCSTLQNEHEALMAVASLLQGPTFLIGYNALAFDWPFLMRRAQYLDVPLTINIDRYKSPHIDLLDRLTHHGRLTSRSLGFYVRRLGWTDLVKPLSGAEEANAPAEGRWEELAASLAYDRDACTRLARWMGIKV